MSFYHIQTPASLIIFTLFIVKSMFTALRGGGGGIFRKITPWRAVENISGCYLGGKNIAYNKTKMKKVEEKQE